MAKAVGRPVRFDQRTKNVIYGNFARVLVEMEVAAPRPEEIQVERKQPGTANLFVFKQQLIYEDSLRICGFCKKKRGHQLNDYREKKAYDECQNTLDKTGIPGAMYGEDRVNSVTSNSPGRAMRFLERDDHNISNSNLNLNIASHISPSTERGETDHVGEKSIKEASLGEEVQVREETNMESSNSEYEEVSSGPEVDQSGSDSSSKTGSESDQSKNLKEGELNQVGPTPGLAVQQENRVVAPSSQGALRVVTRAKRTGVILGGNRGGLAGRGGHTSSNKVHLGPLQFPLSRMEVARMGVHAVDK
ncbi:uncharacterized protein LOC122091562 [Macadamia integrifolia]|uniref:uncharacterized protein LOC122091562 n=1 Tax=Macadamia integrifolia TaxID=60698 RepID=UPI001C4F7C50|nr:uncharacterized protein LOC122091562 [Macadamia integrifolia]